MGGGGSNPDSQQSQNDSALFSSHVSVPGELVPIPEPTSTNDSNDSEDLGSIPDLVSNTSMSGSNQESDSEINTESELPTEPPTISKLSQNSSKERVIENSSSHLSDAENSSKDRLLEESTFHRNFKRTGIGTDTSKKQVTFADQKIAIDKSLSHKKSSRNRSKRSKYSRPGLDRKSVV